MNYDIIVPVKFLFKRKPDNVPIIGLSSLHLTHEEHDALTDDMALKLLREQGYNVIRMIQRDENIIAVNFKERI
ncbi:hypothetical protein LBYS11_16215 [Lysinibacillus sp. YS11]|uniref:hypothetical protein n=1 Tax=Lysinibacillus sp. YS11 TaxID=2072025 RepID=UPI000CA0EAC6|nr:hypothetical protein [Lysinibacillus sp. YS11]AUS87783.1 hypothetical protein LBYS11_16215 [Lysinibacillus sp. YS11]